MDVSRAPRGNTSSRFHRKSSSSELFCTSATLEISVPPELAFGHLHHSLTGVPPQSNPPLPATVVIAVTSQHDPQFNSRILYVEFLRSLKRMMDGFMCICLNVCAAVCFCVPETSTDSNESVCVIKSAESYQSSAPFFFFHTDDDSMITFAFAFVGF